MESGRELDAARGADVGSRWTTLLWVSAALVGTYLRVAGVGAQPILGDETIAIPVIERGYGAILTTFDGRGSHVGFSLLQRACLDLLGATVLAYRVPAVLAGVLTLWLLQPLGKALVGARAASLATLFLALHPMHIYYSRFARPYALAVLALFLLVLVIEKALSGRRSAWIGVLLLAATIPWVHLSATGAVVLLALVSCLWSWRKGGPWRLCAGIFVGAALVCLLLHAPVREGVQTYLDKVSNLKRRVSIEPTVLLAHFGGGLTSGLFLVVGGILGGLALIRRASPAGLLLTAVVLAPFLTLALTLPGGRAWDYARYVLVAVAPMSLAASSGFLTLGEKLVGARGALVLGCGLVLAQAWSGPMHYREHGTFAHSPWTMIFSTEKVDEEFEPVPALYRELQVSPRALEVVEYPYSSSATLLYRHYARTHGQHARVGVRQAANALQTAAPYVVLDELESAEPPVDWVILHLDLRNEILGHLQFLGITGAEKSIQPLGDELALHEERWGPPDYRDEDVVAWRFDRP